MEENNKGYKIEESMKKWFKGTYHGYDCVDFKTKTSLYEVKSCNLFNFCTNNNDKRNHIRKEKHKKITSTQLGRFFIKNYNHTLLREIAIKENKIPKYIFVFSSGNQKIWKVKSWEFVDKLISKNSEHTSVRIKDIFLEEI